MNHACHPHSHTNKAGFALVVTLSLMILLTIVAVGLLSLSSISLRSSSHGEAMAKARSNARIGLMLAIADLQKHAGQDQRITATADLAGDSAGLALAAGTPPMNDKSVDNITKGLSAVQPGTRYWTGVFANTEIQDPLLQSFTKTPSPSIVQWLVSGAATNSPGELPSSPAYAVGPDGQVSDVKKAVVLAGRNTVGEGSGSADRYVVAPLVNITGRQSTNPTGRFGWWVGDEGVKAKINLSKSLATKNNYAALVAQRRGWETVAGFNDPSSPYPGPSTALQESLPNIVSLPGTALLLPSVGTRSGGASPLQGVFHSATTDSRGLLTDSLTGGTKIDLTSILSGALPTASALPAVANYPVKGGNIIPPKINGSNTAAFAMKAPTWDIMKDFYDRSKQLEGGSLIVKGAASNFAPAIAPVVTDFRVLMGVKLKVKDAATGKFNIFACGKIAIAIANPYSYPLKWNNDIEVELVNQSNSGISPSRIHGNLPTKPPFISTTEAAVFNKTVFRIRAASLAPGEVRSYTIGAPVKRAVGNTSRLVVDLKEFGSSSPSNFNNCVELDSTVEYEVPKLTNGRLDLDVRESWQSTIAAVELGLAGVSSSTRLLRRIERFEFDNGYYIPNQRRLTAAEAARITQPFPLMLYSFQISQPGGAYKDYMPASYEMGQRASTLRTFADFNLQATRVRKPIASYNPPPYFAESNDSISQLPANPPGGDTGIGFTRNMAIPYWGRSPKDGGGRAILFSVPSQFSTLGQLQHADLTGDDLNASIGHQPGNAMGNSYATPFVKRGLTAQTRTSYELIGTSGNRSGTNNTSTTYYDVSHLLNTSLLDGYFFSTIPRTGASVPENPTLVALDSDSEASALKDPNAAASLLISDGAFNINSTEKNAWKAFLASSKHFEHAAGATTGANAAFPRGLEQTSPSADQPTGTDADSFTGYRRLTDAQLDSLAGEIVKQVRLRGPFVSVSHFANRALAPIETQPALSRSGALQSAIDESGANIAFQGTKNGFTDVTASEDAVTLRWKNGGPRADYDGSDKDNRPADADSKRPDWAFDSADNNFGTVASIVADQEMLKDAKYIPEQGFRSTGIPGWLTQADVLQVIGSSITAKSDTFRVRAYGEALDASGKTTAKAWCEAIVQRIPSYVDPANAATARGAELSALNKTYGRKYQIVSFRWLSAQEI